MAATRPTLTNEEVNLRLMFTSLLTTAVIRRATNSSVEALNAIIAKHFEYDAYVIGVLEAPIDIRDQVRAKAAEMLRAQGNHGDNDATDLSCLGGFLQILTCFEMLYPSEKDLFIAAYKTVATVVTEGSDLAIREHIVYPGHIPPINVP